MKKINILFSINLIIFFIFLFFIVLIKRFNYSCFLILLLYLSIFSIVFFISIIIKRINIFLINNLILIIFFIFYFRTTSIERFYKKNITGFKNINNILGYIDSYQKLKNNKAEYKLKVFGIKFLDKTDYSKVKLFNITIKLKHYENIILKRGDIIAINKKISIPQIKIFNFYYREYLFYHKIYGIIQLEPDNIRIINNKIKISKASSFLKNTIWKFRDKLILKLKENLTYESFSFILSIYFGERDKMDEDLYNAFCNSGMVHLLAISGLHIGFIGMIFFVFFKLFLSKSKALIVSVILLFFYMLIIVPSASSVRAFLMYAIFVFYFVAGIRVSVVSILSLSAVVLMFYNPFIIFDLGFQYSYLATFGIIFLSGSINEKLPKTLPKKIKSSITVTFSAFFSIFTLQWAIFKKVPFFSLISSIFVVPLFALFFSGTFFLIIIFLSTDLLFIAKIIDLLTIIFLNIVKFLDLINSVNLPEIPRFVAYLTLPLMIVYFYLIEPFLKKKIIKLKVNNINKLIKYKFKGKKLFN